MFLALGATIRACNLPVSLFDDLLSAFRQDITTHRYDDVGRRCSTTAGDRPIRSGGSCFASPATTIRALDRSSDALCTALQLTNFWQDLDRDWQKGRLYVPLDDVDAAARAPQDLDDRRMTEPGSAS